MAWLVFGGSFNPPHVAHVLAVCLARTLLGDEYEGTLVIPTFAHAFGKPLAPFEDRVAMAAAAFAWIPGVEISPIEQELGAPSRTVRTLRELKRRAPERALRLLVGADILGECDKWAEFDAVIALAPLLVLGRQGVRADDAPVALLPELSSTEVRALLERKDWDALATRIPKTVLAYLRARPHLYST